MRAQLKKSSFDAAKKAGFRDNNHIFASQVGTKFASHTTEVHESINSLSEECAR